MFIRVYKRKKTDNLFQWKTFSFYFSIQSCLMKSTAQWYINWKALISILLFFFFISQTAKIKNKWQIQMANDKDMKGGKLRKNKKCRTTQVSKVQNTSKRIFLNKIFHLRIHSSTFHRVITKQKHTTYKHTYIVQDTQWNNKVNKNIYHRWWSN